MHCYCPHTLARYREWLQERFSLDELNRRLLRRYRSWEDVDPPRSNHNIVEMLMYRRFHRDNLVDQLDWMVAEARSIDPVHEMRAHAASTPRPWDPACAGRVDSWGMSMSSNHTLTADDASALADRTFSFDLSRSLGSAGRWWNEEIYAGMSRGGVTWKKQSDPRELTALLWLSLAGGASGVMFWQYRPEYLSFESPGYNLVALDGEPTPRLEAVTRAIAHIDGMADHLPLTCPRADVGIVYHPESQELFGLNDETVVGLAATSGDERFAWDSYRRFIQMYSDVVLGLDHGLFEEALEIAKEDRGYYNDTEMEAQDWQALVEEYLSIAQRDLGHRINLCCGGGKVLIGQAHPIGQHHGARFGLKLAPL